MLSLLVLSVMVVVPGDVIKEKKLRPLLHEQEARDWPSQGRLLSEAHCESLYPRLKYKRGVHAVADEAVLPRTFLARVLMPNGTSALHPLRHDMSVGEATQLMLDKYARSLSGGGRGRAYGGGGGANGSGGAVVDISDEAYVLQIPGTGMLLGEASRALGETEYVRSYLQYRRMPLLRLIDAEGAPRLQHRPSSVLRTRHVWRRAYAPAVGCA